MGRGIVAYFILWIFFVYGLMEFFRKILYEYRTFKARGKTRETVGLIVYDSSTNVEGIIRVLNYHDIAVDRVEVEAEEDEDKAHQEHLQLGKYSQL